MTIAVIPARGGSKRIPRKNIKEFCGRPMIAWSIAAAKSSGLFDAIVVSTDDEEIARIAEANGAEAPFRRPPELADNRTPTIPVIRHAVDWFAKNRQPATLVCCLYATAPLLQAEFLIKGRDVLRAHADADFAVSVTSYAFPIFRALRRREDERVELFWPENDLKRSQDLPEAMHDAGQFYWGRPESWAQRDGVLSSRCYPVVLPRHLVQDIDTPEDWIRAEAMMRLQHTGYGHPPDSR